MNIDLSKLLTERRNANSTHIDTLSTEEMLAVMNREDQQVPHAITPYLPQIAQVVDKAAAALQAGGRLIYMGAGTSGRLGILDASECPPTFGTRHEQVVGLIAGGHTAILRAVENVEDNKTQGAADLQAINFCERDVLVGLAASGRTPYVIGGMEYAKSQNAFVAIISCNPHGEMAQLADAAITPEVGPEVVTGSTRLKAGTAQKLVLNMISTGAMIRIGKVYSNLMVDVEATNAKLIERQVSIVMEATECSRETAQQALDASQRHCKTAIVMVLTGLSADEAKTLLSANNGYIRQALTNR
ncbi:N-acetylmuramic acid 6-phosphate etherase [Yokenella regensburgei]|jgi:N-acetylmuramic acid 6-phosphate etherase|uniref:N-acetylmuramic acid 6-phosphate etherase n=1 Tax=Yokenella regensburgei TaxID=158877 RepID=A0AB38FYH9_9ENTR|nr:N-acetylmuramic acid 6-phosphate etherase [Yokenella regensburgei]EHM50116.1 N-acetylmuramic acid 6-phosphate etherase [Yokenella regensburgei ATCC 43003]KFD24468.1 N-acetylmuramic acid 6-phosphate etherase [Yokenella regensburgei ATCC 49455]MDQ4429843.1 N-acetylmuramic acid 6-phosphate etherase [Yokenella regensburgei]MDR2217736.1 N-acetylmuramic acid 6-phosphate etherase [Yokenella regensburgei]RKR53488.1 N-acetylmuramic acid 6-phosphate etherase [Yokenella regensburgei]